jgi:hypothetical protein
MKYLKSIINDESYDKDLPNKFYYEIGDDLYNTRIVTHYLSGLVKVANEQGGFQGEILAEGPVWQNSIDDLNDHPKIITAEITKEEFEKEYAWTARAVYRNQLRKRRATGQTDHTRLWARTGRGSNQPPLRTLFYDQGSWRWPRFGANHLGRHHSRLWGYAKRCQPPERRGYFHAGT